MPEFILDTSGAIEGVGWADLDAFTQGYIEAMIHHGWGREPFDVRQQRPVGFSDLAPEALARIMADCRKIYPNGLHDSAAHLRGRGVWSERQNTTRWEHLGLGPLTPHLGDDGKVYLS